MKRATLVGLSLFAAGTGFGLYLAACASGRTREPPSVAADWISDDINAGKWDGYTPPPLPEN